MDEMFEEFYDYANIRFMMFQLLIKEIEETAEEIKEIKELAYELVCRLQDEFVFNIHIAEFSKLKSFLKQTGHHVDDKKRHEKDKIEAVNFL